MTPKVSVNIACYNHEAFIGEAIQSVLDQTFQDFELIICNNGSTDRSLEIIESFSDPRIKVESVYPNQQSTFAGNNCILRGCGEYVALLCSDDAWEPTKLEKQVKYLDEHPECGAVFTRVLPYTEKNKPIYSKENFYNQHFNILKNRSRYEWLNDIFYTADHSFCCSSACVRRKCFDELGIFDIRAKHIQDFILWTDICLHYEVHILDEQLTKMRFFESDTNLGSLSDNTLIASLNEMTLLFNKFKQIDDLDEFLKIFPETEKYFKVLDKKYIPFYLALLGLYFPYFMNFRGSAMNLLYEFMGNPENRENVARDFNFTQMELYKITTDFDVYRHKGTKRIELFMIIANAITNFLSRYIIGIWLEEDKLRFKFFGILKTHIRYYPKNEDNKISEILR